MHHATIIQIAKKGNNATLGMEVATVLGSSDLPANLARK